MFSSPYKQTSVVYLPSISAAVKSTACTVHLVCSFISFSNTIFFSRLWLQKACLAFENTSEMCNTGSPALLTLFSLTRANKLTQVRAALVLLVMERN